jgi:hypothetical protein
VLCKTLSGADLDSLEAETPHNSSHFIAACLIDADGKPLFTAEQVDKLQDKRGNVVRRVFIACCEHNGITKG